MPRTFDELIAEADAVSVAGWDFSWLDGRATEQRPSWGYQRLLRRRLAQASAGLDIYTGGGEVLASFTVAKYHDKLLELHQQIQAEGVFATHTSRILIEPRKGAQQ